MLMGTVDCEGSRSKDRGREQLVRWKRYSPYPLLLQTFGLARRSQIVIASISPTFAALLRAAELVSSPRSWIKGFGKI